jgi:hypothetical protein
VTAGVVTIAGLTRRVASATARRAKTAKVRMVFVTRVLWVNEVLALKLVPLPFEPFQSRLNGFLDTPHTLVRKVDARAVARSLIVGALLQLELDS